MNVVGYCRYSSHKQDEGYSIEAQKKAIIEYCQKKEYNLIKFYVDEAKSGTNDNRPAFQLMIKDAENPNRNFEGVVVHKIDRFSRDDFDFAMYRKKFKQLKLKRYSVVEDVDINNNPSAEFMLRIQEFFAAFYPRNLSNEVRKGMNQAALNGNSTGGIPPLGYDTNTETKKYIINESEAKIVKKIYELCLQGYGLKEIADYCNNKSWKTKHYKSFNSQAIKRILTCRKYTGTQIFNQYKDYSNKREPLTEKAELIVTENAFDAIININVWNRAQEKLLLNKKGSYMRRNKEIYLFSGLVHCGLCGEKLCGYSSIKTLSSGEKKEYPAYICKNKKNKEHKCSLKQIGKDEFETTIFNIINDSILNDDVLNIIVKAFKEKIVNNSNKINDEEIKRKKLELSKVETKISRLMDLYLNANLEKNEFENKRKELLLEKEHLKSIINNTTYNVNLTDEEIRNSILKLFNNLKNPDFDISIKKNAISKLIDNIEVTNEKIRVVFKFELPTADNISYGDSYGIRTRECMRERHVS